MPETKIREIADNADMIIRGYLEMYEMWKSDSDNSFYEG